MNRTRVCRVRKKTRTFLFRPFKLVAGAGFEPTIRRLPDYEPDGFGKPVSR